MERISWFPVPDDDELEEPERKLFTKAQERIGFVPNVLRAYVWRPERFRAWFAHFKDVMEPTPGLSARDREMISVAVSMANGCLYCLVAHGAAVRELSDDKVEADRITFDHRRADVTARERAMLDFDGAGRFTGHHEESIGGNYGPSTEGGDYSIKPDCMGITHWTDHPPHTGLPPHNHTIAFTVSQGGNEASFLGIDNSPPGQQHTNVPEPDIEFWGTLKKM